MEFILHLLLTVLLLWNCEGVKATATISPPERAPACIGNQQLELTCNVMGNFLKWDINLFSISSTGDESYSRILSTFSETTYLQVNNTRFTFSRISPQSSLPLESVLLISPVSQYLNGTVVNCTDKTSGESSSTIIITDLNPEINITLLLEQFESDGAVVTLEWVHRNSYWYNVSVTPLLLEIAYSDITRITFSVSYNTHYSVNITALSPCGLKLSTSIALHYVICDDPINLTDNSSKTNITHYKAPAHEGTYVYFNCPPGLLLSGPNSSTCMGNGEWEPTPRDVECKVICGDPINLTDSSSKINITHYRAPALEGTHVYFNCPPGLLLSGSNSSTCMGNGEWEPTPRDVECKAMQMDIRQGSGSLSQSVQIIIISAAVCIICSSLFFTVGLLCHRYCPKQKQLHKSVAPPVTEGQENMPPREILHVAIEQVELTENTAYSTVQLHRK